MTPLRFRLHVDESGVSLVELLVAISLLAVIGSATVTVVVTTSQSQNRTANLGQVMSDARTSLDRIRKEVRGARRVYGGDAPGSTNPAGQSNVSDQDTLSFWIDRNDDDLQQASEQITYQLVDLTASGRFEIVRFTHDDPTDTRSMAKTLVNTDPFSYDVAPPDTRVIDFGMDFQVASGQTFEPLDIGGTVRLRNVADPD